MSAGAQRRAADPAVSAWVGASAGTGKTRVLTERVLRLMLAGTPPEKILCITFTKAAAAEMAERLHKTLAGWATAADRPLVEALQDLLDRHPTGAEETRARRLFAQVLDAPGGMKFQTIHAFCQSLLRRFPLEADLPPHFDLADERVAAELLTAARRRIILDPRSALIAARERLAADLNEEAFAELMTGLVAERGRLHRLLDGHQGLQPLLAALAATLDLPAGTSEAAVLATAAAEGAFAGSALRQAAALLLASDKTTDQGAGRLMADWLAADPDSRARGFDDYALAFLTKEGTPRKSVPTKAVRQRHPDVAAAVETEAERIIRVRERRRAAAVLAGTAAVLTLGEALIVAYEAEKRQRALLDYDDLILAAGRLLDRPDIGPWVLYKLDGGIDHVLVDEAQDTNPDQWQVIAKLTEEFFADAGAGARPPGHRTVFAVGDEKQSIFSFQRADPAAFGAMREHFAARVTACGATWRPVDLETSFRSTRAVLGLVDAVFEDAGARDGLTLDPATPIRHIAHRSRAGGLVELWPALGDDDSQDEAPWTPPTVQGGGQKSYLRLAARIAATIRDWLDRGEMLEARGRPIHAGDILILVRRRNHLFTALVRALKERDVPVAGVDRMVLTEQLAVQDLLALADVLLLPEDDLTLATVLKSPLIGLEEERLFALAHGRTGSLWQALGHAAEAGDAACRAAADYLAGLLARVDYVRPYELFAELLVRPCPADPVSGRRALLARLGAEAEEPLDELLALALAFERDHPPSLQRFRGWLEAGAVEIKREQEQAGRPQVRIMTVHGSKGLQAPIVFLPDTAGTPEDGNRAWPILWPDEDCPVPLWTARKDDADPVALAARRRHLDRQMREYRRLLYVALTRAADRLYIAGCYGRKAPAAGCWHALATAGMARLAEREPVERFETEIGTVLRCHLPQTEPVAPSGDGVGEGRPAAPAAAPLPGWCRRPPPEEPRPPRPLTPSRPSQADPPVRSPRGAADPGPFRRGRLVHTLLQHLPDLPAAARDAACRRFLAQPRHGLAPQDQAALAAETLAVLAHPDFAPLFGPGSRAEVPVVGPVAGLAADPGTGEGPPLILSGVVDRLVVTPAAVLIVDYKTNRPPPTKLAEVPPAYWHQMAAYRAALAALWPDRPIRCALLWTDGPRLMELPAAMLTAPTPQPPRP